MNAIYKSHYNLRTDLNDFFDSDLVLLPEDDQATVQGVCFDKKENQPGCTVHFTVLSFPYKRAIESLALECNLSIHNRYSAFHTLTIEVPSPNDVNNLVKFYRMISVPNPSNYDQETLAIKEFFENLFQE